MSSFSGVVALAGDPESAVAATVEIDAGMLTLNAGGSEIGAWSLEEIEVEQTAQAFNLHADGEDLVLTTPDMAGFADAVGVVADAPKRKGRRRGDDGSPKGEKRRRFGFRSGRDKAASADLEPAPSAVAPPPPPPPPPPPAPFEDHLADHIADPMAGASLEVDEPSLSPPPDLPGFLAEADLPADTGPAFSTAPEMPTFPADAVAAEDIPSASAVQPATNRSPEPEPIVDSSGFADAPTNESSNRSSLMGAAALLSRTDPVDAEADLPSETESDTPHARSDADQPSAISFAPAAVPQVDREPDAPFDPPQPGPATEPAFGFAAPEPTVDPTPAEPTPEPAFEFAAPEPGIDPTIEDSTAAEPLEPATMDPELEPTQEADVAPLDHRADESLAPTNGAPTDDGLSAVSAWETSRQATGRWPEPDTPTEPEPTGHWPEPDTPTEPEPTGHWPEPDTPTEPEPTGHWPEPDTPTEPEPTGHWPEPDTPTEPEPTGHWPEPDTPTEPEPTGHWPEPDTPTEPEPTGHWPEPDTPTEPEPTPPVAESSSEPVEITPLSAEQVASVQRPESAPAAAEVNAPPAEPAADPADEVPDAAGRDVPAIAGIAAVATPDRYITVPPVDPAEEPATPTEHGADMATEEEITAWIADVNGDGAPDGDQIDAVVPSRFETLRHRSAENYSDENVLSPPLTMAMFFTAIALVLGTLLSWGIYELSDAFPVERLVSAVAAFAVAGGAYLGYRQDRRIAGSIMALGGGILALAAVYVYAREADIGIGFLLATAGSVAAVVLGIVGVTRFGHGPDPRIRD